MESIELAKDIGGAVKKAVIVLRQGGIVLYPTDTLYGLGADAFSDEAVDKVYAIKGRDEKKPIHCIVADIEMAREYAEVTDDARLLFERLLPGGLSVILRKRKGIEGGIARDMETIGIRIPKNDFCVQLAREFGKPFTATSANAAGQPPLSSIDAILEQLSYSNVLPPERVTPFSRAGKNIGIDLAVDAGALPESKPSTVVDLTGEEPVILREGAAAAADVWNAIRVERDN